MSLLYAISAGAWAFWGVRDALAGDMNALPADAGMFVFSALMAVAPYRYFTREKQ